jgi:hypothetical protein
LLWALYHPEINHRWETIMEAGHTFEWIFEHPIFVQWATTVEPLLWIPGKPGSGKSTLMKMISQHPRLKILLSAWTEENVVSVATHFFWASGTRMQNSFRGLLMNLLFQVIQQYPQVGDFVFHILREERPDPNSWEEREFASLVEKILHHDFSAGMEQTGSKHRPGNNLSDGSLSYISNSPNSPN